MDKVLPQDKVGKLRHELLHFDFISPYITRRCEFTVSLKSMPLGTTANFNLFYWDSVKNTNTKQCIIGEVVNDALFFKSSEKLGVCI